MASLSTASPCLARATLGPAASCNETGGVSIAASTGRVQRGGPCLVASASSQLFGAGRLAFQCSLASWKQTRRVRNLRIRCERSTEGGNRRSLDTWIGRGAMLTFAAAVWVEISTGKGLLEAARLPKPVPAPVLAFIALAGAITAFGVFRSTERD